MDENRIRYITAAYAAHKKEIVERRIADSIMSVVTILFYLFSIRVVQQRPPSTTMLSGITIKLGGTIIYVIITDLIIYFLIKNYNRLCEMQQTVARFDRVFGMFDKGAYLPGETLYPEAWKTYGTKRAVSIALRAIIPILFGLAVITMFWLRQI